MNILKYITVLSCFVVTDSLLNRFIKFNIFNKVVEPKITSYPKLEYQELTPQHKYDLQWYVIGTSVDFFTNVPQN